MSANTDVRYATAVFSSGELDDTVVSRLKTYEKYDGRIRNAHLSAGNRVTAFLQLYGDAAAAEEIGEAIERHPQAVTYALDADDDIRVYLNFEPIKWTKHLHEVFRNHELIINWPMEPTSDPGLRFTILGQEPAIKDALEELDADGELSVERFGPYRFEYQSNASILTARQREILQRAVRDGYYDLPRAATQEDLAATFDVSAATISEHLRKIESKLLRSIVE